MTVQYCCSNAALYCTAYLWLQICPCVYGNLDNALDKGRINPWTKSATFPGDGRVEIRLTHRAHHRAFLSHNQAFLCTVYCKVHCTVHWKVHWTVHSTVHCTVRSAQYSFKRTVQCAFCTVHCTLYIFPVKGPDEQKQVIVDMSGSLHCTRCTVHNEQWTEHCTHCMHCTHCNVHWLYEDFFICCSLIQAQV